MLTITHALHCDFCGGQISMGVQQIAMGDIPAFPNRRIIFQRDACKECAARCREAVDTYVPARFPVQKAAEV